MIAPFGLEFEIMCFVKDSQILTGSCKYEKLQNLFESSILKKCIYDRKIIYHDKKTGEVDWTRKGSEEMNIR